MTDAELFEKMENESWDLRCRNYPIADTGDVDIEWLVVAHFGDEPNERIVFFGISPKDALRGAIAKPMDLSFAKCKTS